MSRIGAIILVAVLLSIVGVSLATRTVTGAPFLAQSTWLFSQIGLSNTPRYYPINWRELDSEGFLKSSNLHHLVRVTGKLKFDGQITNINVLAGCYGHRPEASYGRGQTILVGNDQQLFQPLTGGGVVLIWTGLWCGLNSDKWTGVPENASSFRASPTWTPVVTWSKYDEELKLAHGEIMLSEEAWRDPNSRLELVEEFSLQTIYPLTSGQVREFADYASSSSNREENPKISRHVAEYSTGSMYIYSEKEWKDPSGNLSLKSGRYSLDEKRLQRLIDFLANPTLPENALLTFAKEGGLRFLFECSEAYGRPNEERCATNHMGPINALLIAHSVGSSIVSSFGVPDLTDAQLGVITNDSELEVDKQFPFRKGDYRRSFPLVCVDGKLLLDKSRAGVARTYSDWCGDPSSAQPRGTFWMDGINVDVSFINPDPCAFHTVTQEIYCWKAN